MLPRNDWALVKNYAEMVRERPSTINDEATRQRVLKAARVLLSLDSKQAHADFDQGRWWITELETGTQWLVIDQKTGNRGPIFEGFRFERFSYLAA